MIRTPVSPTGRVLLTAHYLVALGNASSSILAFISLLLVTHSDGRYTGTELLLFLRRFEAQRLCGFGVVHEAFFTQASQGNDTEEQIDNIQRIFSEQDMDVITNTIMRLWLEDFYKHCKVRLSVFISLSDLTNTGIC